MVASGHGNVSGCLQGPPFFGPGVECVHLIGVSLPHRDARSTPKHVHTVPQGRHRGGVDWLRLAVLVFGLTYTPLLGGEIQAVDSTADRDTGGVLSTKDVRLVTDNHEAVATPALGDGTFR